MLKFGTPVTMPDGTRGVVAGHDGDEAVILHMLDGGPRERVALDLEGLEIAPGHEIAATVAENEANRTAELAAWQARAGVPAHLRADAHPAGEILHPDERTARDARRADINAGHEVSLLAFDPDRDAYVYARLS